MGYFVWLAWWLTCPGHLNEVAYNLP
jgi:hypothetical protein